MSQTPVHNIPLRQKQLKGKRLIPVEEVGRLISQLLANHGGKIGMRQFNATKHTDDVIELRKSRDLIDLYQCIEAEETFILTWEEAGVIKSKIMLGTDLISKVKNGDLELRSQELPGKN